MTLAEHKLYLFRQIDQMPESLLIELEAIIAQLSDKEKYKLSDSIEVEDFSALQTENIKTLWQKGIESGHAGHLDMQAIKQEALKRYHQGKENGNTV